MEYYTGASVMVPYEVLHGKPDDPVCQCMLGSPMYLDLFPEVVRERVYSVLGPHPDLSELLATLRLEKAPASGLLALSFEPCGSRAVLAPAEDSLYLDVGFYNEHVPASGKVWWFDGTVQLAADHRCASRDMPTYLDQGYCYLGLYPRSQWYQLGTRLGAWPTASMLPSGRFPAVVSSVAGAAMASLCHVEALVPPAADQLVSLPSEVRVGGSAAALLVAAHGSQGISRRTPCGPDQVAQEIASVEAGRERADHFYFNEYEPDPCSDCVEAQAGAYTPVRVGFEDVPAVRVGGVGWVLYLPPGCSVARRGVIFRALDGYVFVHGSGPAQFEWSGPRRWLLVSGEHPRVSAVRLRRYDPHYGTPVSELPGVGYYLPYALDSGDPGEALGVYPCSGTVETCSVPGLSGSWEARCVSGPPEWLAGITSSGVYLEPDGVAVLVGSIVVGDHTGVRILYPNRPPGSYHLFRVTSLPTFGKVADSMLNGFKAMMSPYVFSRAPFPRVRDQAGVVCVLPRGLVESIGAGSSAGGG